MLVEIATATPAISRETRYGPATSEGLAHDEIEAIRLVLAQCDGQLDGWVAFMCRGQHAAPRVQLRSMRPFVLPPRAAVAGK